MARKLKTDIAERNIALLGQLMRYLIDHPKAFGVLPDDFELVILPEDDPEIALYNLDLLKKYGRQGKPIVLARVKSSTSNCSPLRCKVSPIHAWLCWMAWLGWMAKSSPLTADLAIRGSKWQSAAANITLFALREKTARQRSPSKGSPSKHS